MSDFDRHPISDSEEKKPVQFSIAFLLWLTAACAFVLGIAIWTPYFFINPVLAVAIAVIIASAYRKGRLALWCSLIGGVATTAVAYVDWLVHVAGSPPIAAEPAGSVFAALFFAIIGLSGGLWLATLPSNYKRMRPPEKTERQPSQVSQDE